MAKKQNTTPAPEPKRFSKQAFLNSEAYRHRTDLLRALLRDDQTYTLEEVQQLIERHMKGKVK